MCYRHRILGLSLIVLGLLVGTFGVIHHGRAACRHEAFERHVAEICVKAAEGVRH
jgi:hypothetical protein